MRRGRCVGCRAFSELTRVLLCPSRTHTLTLCSTIVTANWRGRGFWCVRRGRLVIRIRIAAALVVAVASACLLLALLARRSGKLFLLICSVSSFHALRSRARVRCGSEINICTQPQPQPQPRCISGAVELRCGPFAACRCFCAFSLLSASPLWHCVRSCELYVDRCRRRS